MFFVALLQSLEDRDKRKALIKETLSREQRYLRRKLDALAKSQGCSPTTAAAALAASKRRSVSECSSSTISSSHSSSTTSSHSSAPSPISETGESGYSSSPLPSPTLLAARHPPPPPPGDDHAYHRHTADVFDYDAPGTYTHSSCYKQRQLQNFTKKCAGIVFIYFFDFLLLCFGFYSLYVFA